jgi:hypothetical protein
LFAIAAGDIETALFPRFRMAEMKFTTPLIAALISVSLAGTAAQAQRNAPFTVMETGQTYHRLADAVDAIGGNNATIIIAPGAYGDCAVQKAGRITYKASVPGQTVLDGGICEGKASLVLRVTNSRFEKGNGGHYVKSRAARATINNNSFDDTQGRNTNYMIDLPAGATGVISGNVFVQGENKENWSAFIAIAAEGRDHSSAGLNIHSNSASLAKGVKRNTWFVADWSGDQLRIANNSLGQGLTRYQRR